MVLVNETFAEGYLLYHIHNGNNFFVYIFITTMRVRLRKKTKALSNWQNVLHIAAGLACLILLMLWTPQDREFFDFQSSVGSDDSDSIKWPNPISITSPAMLFIHVGKAGGMTLRVHLPVPLAKNKKELICWRRNETDTANCLAPSNSSALSNHIRGHMHIGSSFFSSDEQDFLMSHTDTFLFSIRNPIDRVISAFYYHQNQKIKYPLFECFQSMNELIESLTGKKLSNDECSQLARRVLQGNTTAGGMHFAYNYQYYEDETVKKKPNHYVAVIRAEHLWQDAKDLDIMLGGTGVLDGNGKRYTHYSTSTEKVSTGKAEINSQDFSTLCCVLAKEMACYTRLLSRAVNLKPSQKRASLRQVQDQCGIHPSLDAQSSVEHLLLLLESSVSC